MKTRISLLPAIAAIIVVCGLTAVCFTQTISDNTDNPNIVFLKTINIKGEALNAKIDEVTDALKYVIFEDKVIFFDKYGKEKILKQGIVKATKNGKYIGVMDGVATGEYSTDIYFAVYDENGNEIVSRRKWLTSDMESEYRFDISDNGKFVFYDTYYGLLYFQQANNILKKVDLFPEGTKNIWTDISSDGKYFAVNAAPGDNSNSAKVDSNARVMLYDINGRKLWTKMLGNITSCEVVFAINNSYLVAIDKIAGIKKTCYVLQVKSSNIIEINDIHRIGNYLAIGSTETKDIILLSNIGRIYYYDIMANRLKWAYEDPDTNIGYTSGDISEDGKYVLVGATTRSYQNPKLPRYVYLFSNDGELIWRKKIRGDDYKNHLAGPNVNILGSSSKIQITTPREILIYKYMLK